MQLKLRRKELKIWKIPEHTLCTKPASAVMCRFLSLLPHYVASEVAA